MGTRTMAENYGPGFPYELAHGPRAAWNAREAEAAATAATAHYREASDHLAAIESEADHLADRMALAATTAAGTAIPRMMRDHETILSRAYRIEALAIEAGEAAAVAIAATVAVIDSADRILRGAPIGDTDGMGWDPGVIDDALAAAAAASGHAAATASAARTARAIETEWSGRLAAAREALAAARDASVCAMIDAAATVIVEADPGDDSGIVGMAHRAIAHAIRMAPAATASPATIETIAARLAAGEAATA